LSRSQKSGGKARAKKRSGGGVLFGIFIGLLVGAILAGAAAWYLVQSAPVRERAAPRAADTSVRAAEGQPIALPGKPGDEPVSCQF
jgi:hypothetical protein